MAKDRSSIPHLAYLSFITAVILWGGSFSAMRKLLDSFHPWTIMWFRMLLAWLALIPFFRKIIPKKLEWKDLKLLIPLVILQPCLYFFLESTALQYTTASQAGIISALVPVFVSLGAIPVFKEKKYPMEILGILLSIAGVVLLTIFQGDNGKASNALLGNLLELGAMAAAACCILILKKLSPRFNPWMLTGLQISAGLIFFAPGLFIFLRDPKPLGLDVNSLLLLYLGVFVTLVAFGLYSWGISKIPVSKASVFINLVPVTAVLFGRFFLKEPLSPGLIVAGMLILLGVSLSQLKSLSQFGPSKSGRKLRK